MSKEPDRLSNEVSLSAKLEDSAVSLNARSRFVSAVDRLLGSIADIPASYFEGVSERIRIRDSQSLKQLRRSDEITEDAVGSLIHDKIMLDYIEAHVNKS